MSSLEVSTETGTGENAVVVSLKGDFTVQYAAEVRTALLKALDEAEQVRLDLASVTDIDLAGLQLLCSAHRTAMEMQRRLDVCMTESETLKRVSGDAGFLRHVGCSKDKGNTCIWLGGTH